MASVSSSTNDSKTYFNTFSPLSSLKQGLESGAIGSLITLTVARSIYKKDMTQTCQQSLMRVDGLKASWLFSAANFPKLGVQAVFYNLFRSLSRNPEDPSQSNIWTDLACSGAAGLVSAPFYNAFEHVALHYHTNDQKLPVTKIADKLFQNRKLQQGLVATAVRDLQFTCIYSTVAPSVCKEINKKMEELKLISDPESKMAPTLIGAAFVGAIGGVIQTPADTLRAVRQYAALNDQRVISYWQSAKTMGLEGLFASWKTKASMGARAVPLVVLANEYLLKPSEAK